MHLPLSNILAASHKLLHATFLLGFQMCHNFLCGFFSNSNVRDMNALLQTRLLSFIFYT